MVPIACASRLAAHHVYRIKLFVNSGLTSLLAVSTGDRGTVQRLIHDAPNRGRTTPALRAATEAAVNLASGTHLFVGLYRGADILVAQNVARTNDHCV